MDSGDRAMAPLSPPVAYCVSDELLSPAPGWVVEVVAPKRGVECVFEGRRGERSLIPDRVDTSDAAARS